MAEREYVGETARIGAPEVNQVADPAPLGLGAFAFTTFMLSLSNANVIKAGAAIAFPAALWFGGITQLLAGMWEFRNNRNTFGATALAGLAIGVAACRREYPLPGPLAAGGRELACESVG